MIFIIKYFIDINCENKCVAQTKHYEELDCKPIIENGESCPTRYECPSLDSLDPNKCYVNGKSFAVGEEIPPKYIQNPCKPECFCDRYEKKIINYYYNLIKYMYYIYKVWWSVSNNYLF